MKRSRQLAAIMFTDIKGYTTLMQQNEEKAIKVREKHRRIFNSKTEKHQGRILQYYGDGTLSIFDSAIDAVNCGIEMQLSFRADPAIPVRIGIHTGDIIFSEDEIIGDGVNVASRIESLSVPGSVFISEKVYDEIKNQESIQTSMLKTFKLKNVKKPIEVYAISNVGLIVPKADEIHGKADPDFPSYPEEQKPLNFVCEPILLTKLYIPPARSKVVPRSRLIDRLNKGLYGKLTLISAPAGFGKTTLASEWVAAGKRPVAWLSIDERDNDYIRFLSYLVAAFQTIIPDIGKGLLDVLQSPKNIPVESFLTAFLNEIISSQKKDITLVLDDYHVISDEQVNNAVIFLLEHLPPDMHLAITTRKDPDLPLPRMRVRNQLTELRISDLRFTPSEVAEFLNQVMDLNLSAENIATLEASTEGWVAGLQLAALSMQGREDITGFINAFAGDDRYIVDYLVEEVLQSQPEHIRNFLLQTSILDRLSGSLCNVVTNQEESQGLLEAMKQGNLFVVPLDNNRQWYRYHHLFADVLYAHLKEEQPDQISGLHLRASEWYYQNDLPSDAVRHALTAKDYERAADLAEMSWPVMERSYQSPTWLRWVREIPEELVQNRLVLIVCYAWALLNGGELEAGDARLRAAEQWLDTMEDKSNLQEASLKGMKVVDEEQFKILPTTIANARAYYSQALGDVSATKKYAQQALDLIPEENYIERGIPTVLLGFAHWATGDLEAAHEAFAKFIADNIKADNIPYAIGPTFILADLRIAQGRLNDAVKIYEEAMQLAKSMEEPMPQGTEDLYLGLGELHRERGNLEAAGQHLQKSEEMYKKAGLADDWYYRLRFTQARLMETEGDLDEALDLLDEAKRLYHRSPVPDVRPIAALKARVWIKQGKIAEALRWANEQNLSFDDDLTYLHEFEHLTLCRLFIARFKNERDDLLIHKATEHLERLLKEAEINDRLGSVIEILVMQALAYEAQSNIPKALTPLERALNLAWPESYLQTFIDEGLPMARLLTEAANRGIMPDYIARLLEVIEAGKTKENL